MITRYEVRITLPNGTLGRDVEWEVDTNTYPPTLVLRSRQTNLLRDALAGMIESAQSEFHAADRDARASEGKHAPESEIRAVEAQAEES